MNFFKRYRFFMFTIVIIIVLFFVNNQIGLKAIKLTGFQFKQMALVIPPIFILLGLLDIWVPRETMVKLMGEKSGVLGVFLAFILGSAAAGPLYGAFPVAAVFMKKGVKLSNVFVFIGAWSTTKIPMLLFEVSALGLRFTLTRLLIDIPGILIIAFVLSHLITKDEQKEIYEKAENL